MTDKQAFNPDSAWESHLGYWALDEQEQSRLADKRIAAAAMLPKGAVLVLFSGQEAPHSVGRFYSDPWFRDLTELREQGCALMCAGGKWELFVPEPDRKSMIWNGYRLGSERSKQALGIVGRPIGEFEKALSMALEAASSLAMDASDESELAHAARKSWNAASRGRNSPMGSKTLIDAPSLLEPLRLIADASEAERLRSSCKIAALGHMSAWEALFRAIAKMPLADSQTASAIMQGDMEGMTPDWEVPGHLGPLAKAMLASGLRAPLSERLLEGAFTGMCGACGADAMAYSPIVAAGENAVCLHWNDNRRLISDEDWVLMDMGCSYAGFASDLTRTVPANGSFSGLRGEVYKLLLDAQLAGIEAAVEGAPFDEPHKVCREILIEGLEEMGLLMPTWAGIVEDGVDWREKALDRVFPHSTSHFIGRIVHDIGSRKVSGRDGLVELRAGMRLTIEPGLYFYPDLPGLPEELSGFGARIEDVCLVSAGGQPPEVLTALCPKDPETIEAFARTCGLLSALNHETNAN